MDEMDQGQISITVDTPAGASLDDKEEVVREILYRLESYPEIEPFISKHQGYQICLTLYF